MSTTLVSAPDLRTPKIFRDEWPFGRLFEGFREVEPTIRVEETLDEDTLVIKAEAPGIDPEKDVEVSMANGKLFISVERRESSDTENNGATRSEFRYGPFTRTIALPEGTPVADVKASYKDEILAVRVPMPPDEGCGDKGPGQAGLN